MWPKTRTVEMRGLRHSGPSSPRRSVGAGSTLDRRREEVEVFTTGFNFPGEGEQSAVAAPPRSAGAADAQSTRDRRWDAVGGFGSEDAETDSQHSTKQHTPGYGEM